MAALLFHHKLHTQDSRPEALALTPPILQMLTVVFLTITGALPVFSFTPSPLARCHALYRKSTYFIPWPPKFLFSVCQPEQTNQCFSRSPSKAFCPQALLLFPFARDGLLNILKANVPRESTNT